MQVHRMIVVTGFNRENVKLAHRTAMEHFVGRRVEVTKPTFRGDHGVTSFFVAPDGALPGTAAYEENQRLRDKFVDWLSRNAGLFDYADVEVPCHKSQGRLLVDEAQMREGVRVVFNAVFEGGIDGIETGEALANVLPLTDDDYASLKSKLETHFGTRIHEEGKWFVSLKDVYSILRATLRRDHGLKRARREEYLPE